MHFIFEYLLPCLIQCVFLVFIVWAWGSCFFVKRKTYQQLSARLYELEACSERLKDDCNALTRYRVEKEFGSKQSDLIARFKRECGIVLPVKIIWDIDFDKKIVTFGNRTYDGLNKCMVNDHSADYSFSVITDGLDLVALSDNIYKDIRMDQMINKNLAMSHCMRYMAQLNAGFGVLF